MFCLNYKMIFNTVFVLCSEMLLLLFYSAPSVLAAKCCEYNWIITLLR